ncbi:hypothetical protein [Lacticaseibacillus thailandensis]|uniref:Uncharacterized protein n=1 Tax=Lacticaseibacillus thailandensis DSM 22698 = JCM 13996 TaxID=1423810 RepID=A0A0R2CHE9_9LACO|nr:hypothetical protein [Lacticaseibacillus thailandensis]KRM87091.1 hypothetical protein FD19_GL001242 [Lacticaseibacillus thailandensis DSM 22698 = JCM 13996]
MWQALTGIFAVVFIVTLVLTIVMIIKKQRNWASTMVTLATISFIATLVCAYVWDQA